jgi:hypothetical protein
MSVNDNRSDPMQSPMAVSTVSRGTIRMIDGRHDPDRWLLISD